LDATPTELLRSPALDAYGGGWPARLRACVGRSGERSAIVGLDHRGPLRLQKGLWPEGPDPVHLILLHPPGGIAGGDSLTTEIEVQPDAHALMTTPGAGRWYRADAASSQHVRLAVRARATLEWLPQETIVHDGAQAEASLELDIDEEACAIGWEIVVLGRRASGERFARGALRQSTRIARAGRSLFDESSLVQGEREQGLAALAGLHVSGLLWAVSSAPIDDSLAESVEAAMLGLAPAYAGASRVAPNLLLARVVDGSPERTRAAFAAAWALLRPELLGRAPRRPRIWAT
jgi:urease accessory protein